MIFEEKHHSIWQIFYLDPETSSGRRSPLTFTLPCFVVMLNLIQYRCHHLIMYSIKLGELSQ